MFKFGRQKRSISEITTNHRSGGETNDPFYTRVADLGGVEPDSTLVK